jgi:hypothetical protein
MNTAAFQTTTTSIILLQRQGLLNKVKYLRYILFHLKTLLYLACLFLFFELKKSIIIFSSILCLQLFKIVIDIFV